MSTTCICVLNYNNGPKTTACISGILDQTLHDYAIIIIDNDSTDDSLQVIKEFLEKKQLRYRLEPVNEPGEISSAADEILIVKSARNGGYSFGNNIGIRLAKSLNRFSYLLIINNDVVLKKKFLEEMVRRYEYLRDSLPTSKIALGATELGKDNSIHHNGFHYLHLLSGISFVTRIFPSFKYIVGSCIFTTIDAPLMDESFFMYFDDTQYSKILCRNGYILQNSPDSFFIHDVGGTVNKDFQRQVFKSMLRFYFINYAWLLPIAVPVRLLLIIYLRIKKVHFQK